MAKLVPTFRHEFRGLVRRYLVKSPVHSDRPAPKNTVHPVLTRSANAFYIAGRTIRFQGKDFQRKTGIPGDLYGVRQSARKRYRRGQSAGCAEFPVLG